MKAEDYVYSCIGSCYVHKETGELFEDDLKEYVQSQLEAKEVQIEDLKGDASAYELLTDQKIKELESQLEKEKEKNIEIKKIIEHLKKESHYKPRIINK